MSVLGRAVIDKMARSRRGTERSDLASVFDEHEVDQIFHEHQVTTAVAVPTPSRLQARFLLFRGIKTLTGVDSFGAKQDSNYTEKVPYEFRWALQPGLNGVGSDGNLRGKSSVLRILMWCLRGRCDLQPDVLSWIDRVEFEFLVDTDVYRVEFDVIHANQHHPNGVLTLSRNGVETNLGRFETNDQFEELMGATMLRALGLPTIASQTEGQRVQHLWPTYAGALVIRGDGLDYLLGDVPYAGLPSRLLSIFVGTEWAAVRAEATTAHSIAKHRLNDLERAAEEHARALSGAYASAQAVLEKARDEADRLTGADVNFEELKRARSEIARLDTEVARLARIQLDAQATFESADADLKVEETRRHQQLEDTVAQRLFQGLRPTVCPRCSVPVPQERIEAESHGEACSVCSTHLDLEFASAGGESNEGISALATSDHETDDDSDDVIDDLAALRKVVLSARQRLEESVKELETIRSERDQYSALLDENRDAVAKVDQRHRALLALARAEGAAEALKPKEGLVGPDSAEIDLLKKQVIILGTAEDVTAEWVRDEQSERFRKLNTSIVSLARDFGITGLTQVELSGNASMKIMKGGASGTFGGAERGEKLRLKLATAIALVKLARTDGIGLHPGLLIVDSPGAEEINDDDFDTMLQALRDEAAAADIQVFVGTCHTEQLVSLLGEERCRIGKGENFVW